MSLLWVMRILLWAFILCIIVFAFLVFQPVPTAYVEKVDEDGTVWIHLSNINVSENTTICVYYGDNVSSKQMWILK